MVFVDERRALALAVVGAALHALLMRNTHWFSVLNYRECAYENSFS